MLTAASTWGEALRELSALPAGQPADLGDVNFLRAGNFRANGRALWDWVRGTHLEEGLTYEVVLGFVDPAVSDETGLLSHPAFVPAMGQFLACHLRCAETGAEVAAELQPGLAA